MSSLDYLSRAIQGMFGDKAATIDRFREVYKTRLTDEMRARLVLENDEMCYNADDLLPVCEELDIPLVVSNASYSIAQIHAETCSSPQFDYHHNWIYVRFLCIARIGPTDSFLLAV